MNPGKLDRQITLLTRTVATDSLGAPVYTWALSCAIWGEQLTLAAAERLGLAGSDRATQSLTFRIRWLNSLESISAPGTFRARYGGRDWDITGCVEDVAQPRRSAMLLSLTAVQGEATLTSVPELP